MPKKSLKKLTKKQMKFLRKHERLHVVMERMFPAHIANRVGFTQPRDPEANFDPVFWMDSFNSRVDANVSRAMNDMVHSEEMVLADEQIVSDEEMERLTDMPEPTPPTTLAGNPDGVSFVIYVGQAYNTYRTACDEGWRVFRAALDEDVPELDTDTIESGAPVLPVNDFTPRHQQMMKAYAVYKSIKDAALRDLDKVWEECYGHRYPRY